MIWGAGSKGVIFAMMMERAGAKPEFAIDINPAKQGKYLPVTGLPVLSPAVAYERLDDRAIVYVMNGNYLMRSGECRWTGTGMSRPMKQAVAEQNQPATTLNPGWTTAT